MRVIVNRQDSFVDQEDEDLRRILAVINHRRNCCMVGHRDCQPPRGVSRCVTGPDGNCRTCRDVATTTLPAKRRLLTNAANLILKQGGSSELIKRGL